MNSNSIADMLAIAKTVARGSFGFNTEIVVRALVFGKKIHIDHIFSVKNPVERRPFQSETDGPDAMALSHPSQRRDLANPLGSEA